MLHPRGSSLTCLGTEAGGGAAAGVKRTTPYTTSTTILSSSLLHTFLLSLYGSPSATMDMPFLSPAPRRSPTDRTLPRKCCNSHLCCRFPCPLDTASELECRQLVLRCGGRVQGREKHNLFMVVRVCELARSHERGLHA